MGFDSDGYEVEQAHYIAIKRACLCFIARPLGLPAGGGINFSPKIFSQKKPLAFVNGFGVAMK
jgi:hypothetical protein